MVLVVVLTVLLSAVFTTLAIIHGMYLSNRVHRLDKILSEHLSLDDRYDHKPEAVSNSKEAEWDCGGR